MKGFDEWSERHARMFGLVTPHGEVDTDMIALWEPAFESAGYTVADLHAASNWIAAHCPPKFRSDHLPAIRDGIQAVRDKREADELPARMKRQREEWARLRAQAYRGGFDFNTVTKRLEDDE